MKFASEDIGNYTVVKNQEHHKFLYFVRFFVLLLWDFVWFVDEDVCTFSFLPWLLNISICRGNYFCCFSFCSCRYCCCCCCWWWISTLVAKLIFSTKRLPGFSFFLFLSLGYHCLQPATLWTKLEKLVSRTRRCGKSECTKRSISVFRFLWSPSIWTWQDSSRRICEVWCVCGGGSRMDGTDWQNEAKLTCSVYSWRSSDRRAPGGLRGGRFLTVAHLLGPGASPPTGTHHLAEGAAPHHRRGQQVGAGRASHIMPPTLSGVSINNMDLCEHGNAGGLFLFLFLCLPWLFFRRKKKSAALSEAVV